MCYIDGQKNKYSVLMVLYYNSLFFVGLPTNFQEQDYVPPSQAPCIIDHLCKKHEGNPLEAKGIKEYFWKIHVKKLFDAGVSVCIAAIVIS
jgi:hypothetical protein